MSPTMTMTTARFLFFLSSRAKKASGAFSLSFHFRCLFCVLIIVIQRRSCDGQTQNQGGGRRRTVMIKTLQIFSFFLFCTSFSFTLTKKTCAPSSSSACSAQPLPRFPRHAQGDGDPDLDRDPPRGALLAGHPFLAPSDPAPPDSRQLGKPRPAPVALREPPCHAPDVSRTEHADDRAGPADCPRARQRPAQPLVPLVDQGARERGKLRVQRSHDGGERSRVSREGVDLLEARR